MVFLYKNELITVEGGTTYLSLAEQVQSEYDAPIILAKVGQKLIELNKEIPTEQSAASVKKPSVLTFITIKERDGHKTYERGATMMFLRAMTKVFKKKIDSIKLEYAIGDGLYFTVNLREVRQLEDGSTQTLGTAELLTEEKVAEVKETMMRYVRDDDKFYKSKMQTDGVKELFRKYGMRYKERLFHYRRTSVTNIYRLGNYVDYFYGYMPPSCGMISVFDLKRLREGLLLILPQQSTPLTPGTDEIPQQLFTTMINTVTWCDNIGVPTVGALNDVISRGGGRDLILSSEAYQEHLIGGFAQRIKDENRRIVMIAGPSSSGKTSFSHRLYIQLANVGLKAHPIAADNYFVDRASMVRDENGEYDFESLSALNVEQFNEHMVALLRGKTVDMPTFDFRQGKQVFNGDMLSIGKDEVLIIEGIHGLNEQFSYNIDRDEKFKIYISAITALNIDEHNRIPTTDNREIRRIVRDARTRGYTAQNTISMWQSVREGEEKHIFPYQESADVMFNSAQVYELAVLKIFAEPLLFSIPQDAPEYPEAKRLLKFLEYFIGLTPEDVPRNSLVREFIGGSVFPVG